MAEATSYIGVRPVTVINNDNTNTLARGVRVTRQASGFVAITSNATRGDYVLLTSLEPAKSGAASPSSGGAKVPALAAGAWNVGDTLFAAANGQFSNAGSVIMGRATLAASGAGVLGECELFEVL